MFNNYNNNNNNNNPNKNAWNGNKKPWFKKKWSKKKPADDATSEDSDRQRPTFNKNFKTNKKLYTDNSNAANNSDMDDESSNLLIFDATG